MQLGKGVDVFACKMKMMELMTPMDEHNLWMTENTSKIPKTETKVFCSRSL